MYKLYGIPNCDTVKKARTFMDKHKLNYEFVDFKKTSPTPQQIASWALAFGGLPVNLKGQTYKKHQVVYENLTEAKKSAFLTENTSMLKRPILEKNGKVLAFGYDETEYTIMTGK